MSSLTSSCEGHMYVYKPSLRLKLFLTKAINSHTFLSHLFRLDTSDPQPSYPFFLSHEMGYVDLKLLQSKPPSFPLTVSLCDRKHYDYSMHISYTYRCVVSIVLISRDTGYIRKVYRSLQVRVPHDILKYTSIQKWPQKRSIYLSNSHKKIFILCFITNIYIYM